jgi:hypothetical protein
MTGETNLEKLINTMSPILNDGEYVFHSSPDTGYGDYPELRPIISVQESEGLTLVIPKESADVNAIAYDSVFRMITLEVHSSLDAVGLTAAFAKTLTEYGISANVVAGFFHDHIFVQLQDADKAMTALAELSQTIK